MGATGKKGPKVLHLSTTARGGAGIAAFRLYEAQRARGHQVAFLSKTIAIDFEGTELVDHSLSYKRPGPWKRAMIKINRLFTRNKVLSHIRDIQESTQAEMVSSPYGPKAMNTHPLVISADIIHLHWVSGWIDYPSFFKEVRKPMVWTLHDANPFMGLFHYPMDLEINRSLVNSLEDQVKEIKKGGMALSNQLTITAPSKWLLNQARESGQFPKGSSFLCVPNSVDTNNFRPSKSTLRSRLGLTEEEEVVMYIAGSQNIRRKGLDLLLKALALLDRDISILTIGKSDRPMDATAANVINLGFITDAGQLVEAYNAADALILPSLEDNLPNTMLESLACGTPVVAFDRGGMKEHLSDPDRGQLVSDQTPEALAIGIEKFMDRRRQLQVNKIRDYALKHFSPDVQVAAYKETYEELLKD
ncbi:glycosyltransferase [Aureitalea marina]|uniref:Uncharacterized protein n=1 Tax=Aureitalea marina TaxID=930804 RepID=A0A2S7KMQ0_9FLAO|nr:glycosyltransferase [Aureitalea marina]PQB03882.1 hypothetical protein BST85_02395 [Aureitalea marina]